jgi:hypothetical protein
MNKTLSLKQFLYLLPLGILLVMSHPGLSQNKYEEVGVKIDQSDTFNSRSPLLDCPENSIFSQPPVSSTAALVSDDETVITNQIEFDLFYGITEPIGGITFWGTFIDYNVSGVDCYVPGTYTFNINFYEDNLGSIGTFVRQFTVSVIPSSTGIVLNNGTVLRFEVTLPDAVKMQSGWVSVVRHNPNNLPCLFGWANTFVGSGDGTHYYNQFGGSYIFSTLGDLSFCLTGVASEIPISPWAIAIGIVLIAGATVLRIRRFS